MAVLKLVSVVVCLLRLCESGNLGCDGGGNVVVVVVLVLVCCGCGCGCGGGGDGGEGDGRGFVMVELCSWFCCLWW